MMTKRSKNYIELIFYYGSLSFLVPDKKLFTPGPLLTSRTVKEAMLRDLGSRDSEFIRTIKTFRDGLLQVAGVNFINV